MLISGMIYKITGNVENLKEVLEVKKIKSLEKFSECGKEFCYLCFLNGFNIYFDEFKMDEEYETICFYHKD